MQQLVQLFEGFAFGGSMFLKAFGFNSILPAASHVRLSSKVLPSKVLCS